MTVDISAGITWLEEHAKPGWRTAVDPEKLEMASSHRCVCGQLFRSGFLEGSSDPELSPFAKVIDHYRLSVSDAQRFGFGWLDDFSAATWAWGAFFDSENAWEASQ